MKTLSATLFAVATVFAAGAVSAQNSKAPAAGQGAEPMCCMDAHLPTSPMEAHMKRMQTLHEPVASATTPEDRQRLMDDQRRDMQQGMAMMQAMPRGGPMAGGAGMGTMGHEGKPADQKSQMQMMETRVDMRQTMMRVMMDRLDASGSGTVPAPTK